MPLRCSYVVEICFGPIPFRAKAYSVAGERSAGLSQVHAGCGGKLEQQYVCAEEGTVVPKAGIAKQHSAPDGTLRMLTEEVIKRAESERFGQLEAVEFVPEESVDPLLFGKTFILGPDDENIDAYAAFVDALAETKTAAIGVYFGRGRDQLLVIQRYGERGLWMRELFYANELRPVGEIEFPVSSRASLPPGAFALWTAAVERLRRPAFHVDPYSDGCPQRLLEAAEDGSPAAEATPLLEAARRKAATGSTKKAQEERRAPAPVHALPTRDERETRDAPETAKRGT